MSLEGWYYCFVLAFIGGAAILRRANLLLILAAMLTAPLLFNWRFVMASLRNLVLRRKVPSFATAGKTFRVDLTLANSAVMDSWHVQVDETITETTGRHPTSVAVVVDRVPFQNNTTRSYECLLWKRGVYAVKPSVISTSYPIGLVRASAKIDNEETIFVGPPLGKLSPIWLNWANPDEVDEPRSAGQKGILDGMFYAVREYRQGDSRRAIHWRSTAKLGKLAVKQFEKQSDRELNIVLDLHTDPGPSAAGNESATGSGTAPLSAEQIARSELALSFVATFFDQVYALGRFEVNLLVVANRHKILTGHASQMMKESVAQTLAQIQPDNCLDLNLCIDRFLESKSHRSPIIVVSTRSSVHENAVKIAGDSPFPFYILPTTSEVELPCCWIDVNDPAFLKIFEPPASLLEDSK